MVITKEDWKLNQEHGLAELEGFVEAFSPGNFWSQDEDKATWERIDIETYNAMNMYLGHVAHGTAVCLGAQFAISVVASFHLTKLESWDWPDKTGSDPRIFHVRWYKTIVDGLGVHKESIKSTTYEQFKETMENNPDIQELFEEQINERKAPKH